ncbi:MAG: hypothetical protein Q8L01_00665 [Candidatus Woesebacteria bacterium]|nr:hypothetical protein [Candidatus Woesebacteria bacterium]
MSKSGVFWRGSTIISTLAISALAIIAVGVIPKEQAQTANVCSAGPVSAATFVKTFHLLDLTDGFGVLPAKDGGYFLTGDTIPASGMAAPKPFVVKTDAKGGLAWSRWYSSQSMALGQMSLRRIGRLAAETADGNLVTAIDAIDFVDENLKEIYGDVLVTKLNKKGTQLWSVMLGDYSTDRPHKIWALPDGGVLLLARFMETGHGDVADTDAVPNYSVLLKIDKNGKVQSAKKMSWNATDAQYLADGGFIVLADVAVAEAPQPANILGPEITPHALPTMIKLDANLNAIWAKSLEMIPLELNAPTSYTTSSFTMGKTKVRMAGGDFRAVQPTPDGGFIAFGFGDLISNHGLITGAAKSFTSFTPRPLIAVKVDAAGNYQWAKKLADNQTSGISSNDFQVVRTVDSQFVIMQDVVRDSAAAQTPDFKLDLKALAANIELIKTDADFNPRWIKKYDLERDVSGYGVQPTADKGVVVAGSMLTNKQHMVMMSMEPYKEAVLIKVDANGAVAGCVGVSDLLRAAVEDQSQYLVMQNMKVGTTADLKLNINKKVKEKVSAIKNTARDICQYQKNSVTPLCSYLTSEAAAVPPAGQPAPPPVAKTWALINFENAKAGKIESEKNQTIHDELLPILNQVFNNQVKMTDSMNSMWLAYVFPRPATRADVETVQKKYEALGYKIDESEGGRLFVSKIGLTLHMTFAIQNSMAGKLEVLF